MKSLALVLAFAAATAIEAQTAPPPPDIAFFTNVHARELRFFEVGEVRTRVFGSVNGQQALVVDKSDRQNLPDKVQTYVVYRDIGIQLTITSTLPDIERIVDEALAPEPVKPPNRNPKPKR